MFEKKTKNKPPYSSLNNLKFMLKKTWRWNKSLIFLGIIRIPILVVLPLIGIYLSKFIVSFVISNADPVQMISYIFIFSIILLILNIIDKYSFYKLQWGGNMMRYQYLNLCSEKIMDTDFENIENPDGQLILQKAVKLFNSFRPMDSLGAREVGAEQIVTGLVSLLTNLVGIITYSFILVTLSPILIIFLIGTTVIDYLIGKNLAKWNYENKNNWVQIDRKINYIKTVAGEFSKAKDIRLYNMITWFKDILESLLKTRTYWYKYVEKKSLKSDLLMCVIALFRDGISIGFLIYIMYTKQMPVSDFILYFGVIGGFSTWLLNFSANINAMFSTCLNFCDFREFLDMEDKLNRGVGEQIPKESSKIQFKNVGFKYSGSEKEIFENFNLTIEKGEKIAIVGVNGAGKTTLVKLLCGLYRPTKGEVLINGKKTTDYNRDELYTIFSAVFQDIYLLPSSIAKNVALCSKKDIDYNRVNEVLKIAGIYEKVQSLKDGVDTLLLKSILDNAIDLSGGEQQKLSIARSLYKKGRIIILDEPTAALDPIAENEVYLKYNEITEGRTSIFISHRLSSTRFCDRIIFLEDGKIAEIGDHDSLMKLNGKYAEMFETQSKYYKSSEEDYSACQKI